MIFDTIDRLSFYLPADVWEKLKPVVEQIGADAPVGDIAVEGTDIFAAVAVYETKPEEECRFETHVKYADIQIVLSGTEKIGVAPAEWLSAATEHDTARDVRFYQPAAPPARLTMQPGAFAIFFPQDAHQPQVSPEGEKSTVKKMVVKIRAARLTGGFAPC